MKRMMALVLSLVMALSLCVCPVWGAGAETEAQEFIDTYLTNDNGIISYVKGYDGSLRGVLASKEAWDTLTDAAKEKVNELVAAAHPDLSYETLWEYSQGFIFMIENLMIYEEGGEVDFEGYIFSTDPKGGTLVDPDPPHDTFFVMPFTHDIWKRIVGAETVWNDLPDNAKAYLDRLLTEEDFGLNSGLNPSTLQVASFTDLLKEAKENLSDYERIESKLAGANSAMVGGLTPAMVDAIANGEKVEFKVLDGEEQKIDAGSVGSETKDAFEQAMKDFDLKGHTISSYLEIEIQVRVDKGTPYSINRTADKIEICLGKAEPGREYTVLRNHEGRIDLLDAYVRNGLIYAKSSYFSTYAVVEKPKTTGGYVGGYVPVTEESDTTVTSPKTFDAGVGLAAAATVLSMTGVVWLGKKKD